MNDKEHEEIHLINDLYQHLSWMDKNQLHFPHELSKQVIELKERMEKLYNIKGE